MRFLKVIQQKLQHKLSKVLSQKPAQKMPKQPQTSAPLLAGQGLPISENVVQRSSVACQTILNITPQLRRAAGAHGNVVQATSARRLQLLKLAIHGKRRHAEFSKGAQAENGNKLPA